MRRYTYFTDYRRRIALASRFTRHRVGTLATGYHIRTRTAVFGLKFYMHATFCIINFESKLCNKYLKNNPGPVLPAQSCYLTQYLN